MTAKCVIDRLPKYIKREREGEAGGVARLGGRGMGNGAVEKPAAINLTGQKKERRK